MNQNTRENAIKHLEAAGFEVGSGYIDRVRAKRWSKHVPHKHAIRGIACGLTSDTRIAVYAFDELAYSFEATEIETELPRALDKAKVLHAKLLADEAAEIAKHESDEKAWLDTRLEMAHRLRERGAEVTWRACDDFFTLKTEDGEVNVVAVHEFPGHSVGAFEIKGLRICERPLTPEVKAMCLLAFVAAYHRCR